MYRRESYPQLAAGRSVLDLKSIDGSMVVCLLPETNTVQVLPVESRVVFGLEMVRVGEQPYDIPPSFDGKKQTKRLLSLGANGTVPSILPCTITVTLF